MTVVSGKIVFCEGKQASLDASLLNRIIENLSSDRVTIVPTGSKFSFSGFAQGFFSPNEIGDQKYIIFRDRDFDMCPTEDIKLLKITSNRTGKVIAFLTHRTCVENYLIDANLIHDCWNEKYEEKQQNPSSKWGKKESPGVNKIEAWIESSARELQEYQAVRWALGDLLQMTQARTQLKTTWTGGSGKLPSSLTIEDCETGAKNLIRQFSQDVADVTEEIFESSLLEYRRKFSQPEFWTQKKYLVWFHGKDLQKMMQKQDDHYISLEKDFFPWAVTQLDITGYPDLMELRTRIEQL